MHNPTHSSQLYRRPQFGDRPRPADVCPFCHQGNFTAPHCKRCNVWGYVSECSPWFRGDRSKSRKWNNAQREAGNLASTMADHVVNDLDDQDDDNYSHLNN
jgi:hypothetical protein